PASWRPLGRRCPLSAACYRHWSPPCYRHWSPPGDFRCAAGILTYGVGFQDFAPGGLQTCLSGRPNRRKNLGMIAKETLSGSHASASLSSNGGSDSRVARGLERHAGVDESVVPA